ncbi:MAG: hypothetical protein KGI30_10975, partial [Planctomycetota bacterium]|nr:hypothetical protein [Planctomycetota bacterium]
MKLHRLLLTLFILISLVGCTNFGKPKLFEREKIYGTDGEALSIFHRVAEKDGGLGLKFPGYLIGVEKAYRDKIGWHKDLEIINEEKFHGNDKYRKNVLKILDDSKRTFVSHIVEYRLDPSKGYVKEDFFYNAYDKCFCPTEAYLKGLVALDELRNRMFSDETPYTHIFLYSMGWNTDQQESLRNYNSLVSLMIKDKGEKPFRPLFIGISWPSEWRSQFLGGFVSVMSYSTKADDADEVGILWINKVLWNLLVPLKKERKIPLILVGHSFGARIMTRAVFSCGLIDAPKITGKSTGTFQKDEYDIDLVIGLQGAFSINRFISGEGEEGSPYSEFYKDKYTKKFIFTWSKRDFANPIARFFTGASHVGGRYGHKRSLEFDKLFDQFTIEVKNDLTCSYDFDYDGIKEKQEWSQSFSRPEKISIVNASNLIRNKPYGKGGNAHSDIY